MTKTLLITVILFFTLALKAQDPVVSPSVNEQESFYTTVEEMPEYPGGTKELLNFINSNIKYPESVKQNSINGRCYLKFIVDSDGTVKDIKVLKGVTGCPECDEEAKRVVMIMPKWKPGKVNGKPVPVSFNLPVTFRSK